MKPKAILVDVIDPEMTAVEANSRLEELESLVKTFGGIAVLKTYQKRGVPDYETYIGKGKVNEIKEFAAERGANLLILNNILKPRQVYNLSERFRDQKVEVWDRVELILKIFEKHAKSAEAKLQIELAKIKHMGPRITGMGTELARQEGRVGVRAGQGESNIELMKRHLRKKELNILKKLEHYDTVRQGQRKMRRRKNFKTAALVGYTNAGKSSLLNALTKKDVYIADELFATLDTRVGKLFIPETHTEILVSDTIGFIQDLPPTLIQAFKSTLSETIEADLLLHVIDISDPLMHKKIQVVHKILAQLGIKDQPQLYIFNKTDRVWHPEFFEEEEKLIDSQRTTTLLKAGKNTSRLLGWSTEDARNDPNRSPLTTAPSKLRRKYGPTRTHFVSAHKREGLQELKRLVEKHI